MEKKYILTEETLQLGDIILHRIKAVKDFSNVKNGDLGGWIEKEENLSHKNNCWVYINAQVYGDALVFGNAQVFGDSKVFGNALVFGNAKVYENAQVYENAKVYENAQVYENAKVFGDSKVFGNAQVYKNAQVYENAQVFGDSKVFGNAQVFGNALMRENALIFGNALVFGNAQIFGYVWVNNICKFGKNAYIDSAKNYYICGPIGSRKDITTFYKTENDGIWVSCGCFNDSIERFISRVQEKHGGTVHEKNYLAAITAAKIILG